jgi:uncharacterized protein YkwD
VARIRDLGRRSLAAGLLAVVFMATPSLTSASFAATTDQKGLLTLTNADRDSHHRHDLKLDDALSRYATAHSREMANHRSLFHTSNLAGKLHGIHWRVAGENVGFTSGTLDDMETSFMHSPEHKKNILNGSFDHAAIGVVDKNGGLWITVIFYG